MSGADTTGCPRWAGPRATVCHAEKEWARDDDGDGIREVHVNTLEGLWTGLRNFLRPFRGVNKVYLYQYVAMFEWGYNIKRVTAAFVWRTVGCAVCHHLPYMSHVPVLRLLRSARVFGHLKGRRRRPSSVRRGSPDPAVGLTEGLPVGSGRPARPRGECGRGRPSVGRTAATLRVPGDPRRTLRSTGAEGSVPLVGRPAGSGTCAEGSGPRIGTLFTASS